MVAHRIIHTFRLLIHFDGFVILFVFIVGISNVILFLRQLFVKRIQQCSTLAVLFGLVSLFCCFNRLKISHACLQASE